MGKKNSKLNVITDLKDVAGDATTKSKNKVVDTLLFVAGRTPNERHIRLAVLTTILTVLLEKNPKKVKRAIRKAKLKNAFRR